ncbi:MAG: cytochrome P450 [Pseudomonadales bacterium]
MNTPTLRDACDMPLEEIDVSQPTLYQNDTWRPYFARLRREAPVHYLADSINGPFWSITRFDDIMAVDKNNHVFSSDFTLGGVTIQGRGSSVQEYPMFIQMDAPAHDAQRLTVAPMFTQRSLASLETLIRERVGEILDALPVGETFDWVPAVSVELTSRMLATLFDVPQADRHRLIGWSNTISNADDPAYVTDVAQFWEALADCGDYFAALWAHKQQHPGVFDLLTMLSQSTATRDMDARQLLGNIILLLVGGNDTTRNSISGSVLALNDFPAEYEKLRASPALVHSLVPEVIRWQTPLVHMRRTVREDTELRGQTLRRGDKVVMWYLSGNRDENEFADADKLIIDRPNARGHVSFGFGVHRCMGNRLAEMQLRILWEEIMKRFHTVELVGDVERLPNNFIRGIRNVPVRLHPL